MGLESYPLTPVQEEILLQTLRQPLGGGVYLAHVVLRIMEEVDTSYLESACLRVMDHHSSLRTRFDWQTAGRPLQIVEENCELPFISEDWRELPVREQKGRLRGFLIGDRFNGFDLGKAPLIRVALIRFGQADYGLILSFHQIILDDHSAAQVLTEVHDCYRALSRGREWTPDAAPDFGAFTEWFRENRAEPGEAFWRSYLEGFNSPTPIPPPLPLTDAPGSDKRIEPGDTITAASERRGLEAELTGALGELARGWGLDLRCLLWGAWAIMLGRYGDRREVLFGVTDSIRGLTPSELSGVGTYLNTLPLRVDLEPRARVGEWLTDLAGVRESLTGREATALSRIRAQSPLPGGEPLFETYLAFEKEQFAARLEKGGVDWAGLEVSTETRTPVPLMLSVGAGENLILELEYDRRRYSRGAAVRMIDQVETILKGMVKDPRSRLAQLPALTGAEARRLFVDWQPPVPKEPPEMRAHHIFSTVAAWDPKAVAVQQGEDRLTYGELEEKANQWARHLQGLGVGPESLVGLCLDRSPDQIVLLLAILKAGGAYLPLDPEYPLERLNYMIENAGVEVVVAWGAMPRLAGLKVAGVVLVEDASEEAATLSPEPPECGTGPDSLAYLIYTSGSTGLPKGVMVEHRALANYILNSCTPYKIRPGDRCLQFASISFDASLEEIFTALLNGATLVLRTEEMTSTIPTFLETCREWDLTVLGLPTAFWHLLSEEMEPGGLPPKVRMAIIGGEAARPDKLALWQAKAGPEVVLFNCYGPTEATIGATLADLSRETIGEQVAIGRAVSSLRVYVLDENGRPVPQGAPGELFLAGGHLARGYLGRPNLTAERFPVLNPVPAEFRGKEGDFGQVRMYRTGDKVRFRSDGQLLYLDRYDRQIQIRGFRVELGEVEEALAGHPEVKAALVDAREDGSGEKTLVGYILPQGGLAEDRLQEELEGRLTSGLPAYMRPSALVFIEEVPLTRSGKVDYQALPDPDRAQAAQSRLEEPRTDLERSLVALWEEVLGIKGIGTGDNFFDLGGHSLLAVKLISRIEKTLGRTVHPLRLFQSPTVAGLAGFLEGEQDEAPLSCLETYQDKGHKPPLFFVGSSLLAPNLTRYLGESQPFYGLNVFGLQNREGEIPFRTLKDIAVKFVAEIKKVQPSGPFRLAGYCADGDVAMEMALLLLEEGEEVELLAYVDSFWEWDNSRFGLVRHRMNLKRFGWSYVRSKLRQKQRTLRNKINEHWADLESWIRRRAGWKIPARVTTHLFIKAWHQALRVYQVKPFPRPICILLASEWGGRVDQELLDRIALGGYYLKEIPGFHDNLFEEPQVRDLGRNLRECLKDADEADEADRGGRAVISA